jgi:hypothetical protein
MRPSAVVAQNSLHFTPRDSPTRESFGNYNLIKRVKLDFTDVVVSKWKSSVTGLTVIHLDYEGKFLLCPLLTFLLDISFAAPIVDGYFVVPTESTLLIYFQLLSLKLLQFSTIQAALTHSNSTHNF